MSILATLTHPADVKRLKPEDLAQLSEEIREFLVEKVAATGGHLGPNLGVVELTIALHRVFDSPKDPIIFDTSHQSYVHKMLTGRMNQFDTLRQKGGLSGYTSRKESPHDWVESSHASASLSYADGLAKAFEIKGETDRCVVAVVGDGALTGGMCWEALNNIAASKKRKVVIVVNDNGRSYSPTIGGFAENLKKLRTLPTYDRVMEHGKYTLKRLGWVGERTFDALHAFKEGLKSTVIPTEMFNELGIKYVGPVNGHDSEALEDVLNYARDFEGPLIVHVVTEKGRGYPPAENDAAELMHSTGAIDPVSGLPVSKDSPGWTAIFSKALVAAGGRRDDIVAITAAMAGPTGLVPFQQRFPARFFDVGIAEQHALTSAAGLALGGLHPVVAVYATFLNRAFDQLLMDVALLKQPVTLVLDRAGVTGSDGASHNGVWDFAITGIVPGIHVAAPRDGLKLRELFDEAIEIQGPSVVRFPKGALPPVFPALEKRADGVEVLYSSARDAEKKILVIAVGPMAEPALSAVEACTHIPVDFTVIDPCWVVPVAPSILEMALDHDLVVTIEDGVIHGGIGSMIAESLAASDIDTPIRQLAFPEIFPEHASRNELLAEVGLDARGITASLQGWIETLVASCPIDETAENPEY
ncbi:1-deoxy-D-xylulose-5-phosphate synthase [Corynebacterium sp. ES2794-CONJ1]|uniref:1-deoxy-D-xylulose-5-phosphate synthase n=1 Tax=unclassified Corynebacterium TaxID=2624378 RepID=UPI002167788B|nr:MULTISPECIES: 1-deoxy-D-xylulose-5-phosphate synthase [unclassified Corynebacterium]MCS4489204.1 1-deoxy-D-xylulose-5-phosphate synthase [Corynebacterium sp. ES2775-CONJ]MCS4491017.1 1-deoxy-D-xylulose-5-phosphate synthase [Corynebacterium sp. ES2715-CONJ3]MCS4531102.1 1-deoxy-D-xylulose-5-phosphate synthase [Corynebacterium sp. ES2730-CONJ]MCU9518469.1 1-deoxy-D-xylulose-5-phosphate synthase [Corynebacterium sp. ES2794-CONJ1]